MISALLALSTLAAQSSEQLAEQVELIPNGNAWVYPHAADPTSDEWLRFWGNAGNSVDEPDFGNLSLSYSLIQFDVSSLESTDITTAFLHLWQDAPFTFIEEESRQRPVEVRFVPGYFNEQSYTFNDAINYVPARGPESLIATGYGRVPHDQVPYEIVIDLTAAGGEGEVDFREIVREAKEGNGLILLALTSTMDPQEVAEGAIYKVFSRHTPKVEYRPRLVVTVAR